MRKAFFFLIIIFFVNIISLYYGWYLRYPWSDQVLHFSGGFFMAMIFSIYLKNHLLKNEKIKNILIVVSAVAFIGIVWEFSEYLASLTLIDPIYTHFHVRTYFIGDLDDTFNDLLMDILGASLFAISFLHPFWRRKPHKA